MAGTERNRRPHWRESPWFMGRGTPAVSLGMLARWGTRRPKREKRVAICQHVLWIGRRQLPPRSIPLRFRGLSVTLIHLNPPLPPPSHTHTHTHTSATSPPPPPHTHKHLCPGQTPTRVLNPHLLSFVPTDPRTKFSVLKTISTAEPVVGSNWFENLVSFCGQTRGLEGM